MPESDGRNKAQVCPICLRRFTAYTWEHRHVHEGQPQPVHARCCPQCHGVAQPDLVAQLAAVIRQRDALIAENARLRAVLAADESGPRPKPVRQAPSVSMEPRVWPIT